MRSDISVACALAVLLGGCAATSPGPAWLAAAPDQPAGYRYYDNYHPNNVNSPSPEAIENARRGTYLWPPSTGEVH